MQNSKIIRTVVVLAVVAISYFGKNYLNVDELTKPTNDVSASTIESLFASRTSDKVVEISGRVKALLPDDTVGSKHQKFILELESGHTILVSHNISLAPRVPAKRGDLIELRGEYEWTEKGGVVHWTHHDPGGKRPGGWIRLRGATYK